MRREELPGSKTELMKLPAGILARRRSGERVTKSTTRQGVDDHERHFEPLRSHSRMHSRDDHGVTLGVMSGAVGMMLGGATGDRYVLRAPLGSGAFGDAWEAYDQDEDDIVVVKLLDPSTHPDDVLREASLHRRLSRHPRVVSMRNVELGVNPSSFVVSDIVPGGSLDKVLDARNPSVVESQRWLRDVLEALAHAHGMSVLHRDIKPSNLLLGPDGHAMLTDFGVAEDSVRRAANEPGMYPLTLPPEFGAGPTTVRTDLWLVGVLGWHLLAGRRPDINLAHVGAEQAVHRLSVEVPLALSRVIAWAMAPDPADRPENAERMLDAVGKVPVHAGWHELASKPDTHRAWRADDAGGRVTVEIRQRRRGDYEVIARAPAGSRLRTRRSAVCGTQAAALGQARTWLLMVVAGERL